MTTAIDYDKLLWLFVSEDDLRPAMMVPNTVGDKTYATDAHALIIIPNHLLTKEYPAHPKTPDYNFALDQLSICEELFLRTLNYSGP